MSLLEVLISLTMVAASITVGIDVTRSALHRLSALPAEAEATRVATSLLATYTPTANVDRQQYGYDKQRGITWTIRQDDIGNTTPPLIDVTAAVRIVRGGLSVERTVSTLKARTLYHDQE